MVPYAEVENLDEESQRRIVLQAAKRAAPNVFRDFRKVQPTVRELDSKISTDFWAYVVLGFFVIIPWAILPFALIPLWNVRRAIRQDWRQFLADPDPECERLTMAGAIRRELRKLPRKLNRQVKEIVRELDRIDRHWEDLHARSQHIAALGVVDSTADLRQAELRLRIAETTDSLVRSSLEKQLESILGSAEAAKSLTVWRERLAAAQDECRESLLHLRSRLAVMGAAGDVDQAAAVTDVGVGLHELNARLAAAQSATEEVLQLSAHT